MNEPNHFTIALEEHYVDAELEALVGAAGGTLAARLRDVGKQRLHEMDEAGIDVQVLSHAPPGLQRVGAASAADVAARVNDRLAEIVATRPNRFAAFASLPTTDPEAAARELERTVRTLGFKGAMVHGPTDGLFLDEEQFWPILERAEALDVPIYLHPASLMASVRDAYIGKYAKTHPMFAAAAWGFTIETGTHAMRMVLSGALERFPGLKIILGHLGETIPFLMSRIDEALKRDTPTKNFREQFNAHFYVTTSGFFSDAALSCCMQEMGADRILFSVDWPFVENADGVEWLRRYHMSDSDKKKIFGGNAAELLRLDVGRN